MSTVKPTDKTLVNRAGVDHSAPADMSTVKDTDLLLINRAGVDYKCTFADWKNSQVKPPDVGAVTLADVAGGDRFTSVAFPVSATMTDDGIPTSTKKLKAYVEGSLKSAAQTSAITNVADHTWNLTNKWTAVGYVHPSGSSGPFNAGFGYVWYKDKTTMTWDAKSQSDFPQVISGNGKIQIAWSGSNANYSGNEFVFTNSLDGTEHRCSWSNPGDSITTETHVDLFNGQYSFDAFKIENLAGSGVYCGGFAGIYIDGVKLIEAQKTTTLTLTDNTQLTNFAAGDAITEVTSTGTAGDATGTVGGVDAVAKTIMLTITAGTWDVGSAVKGPPKPVGNVKLYCRLDAAGAVSDLQSADPGFTAWTPAGTGPYTGTVTFPATLPTGNAPDADLPAGTTVTVEVEASNTAGTDSATSNTVTPA